MGLLDDAIREHLDLKRRRGADPEEIERAEREALGPARRGAGTLSAERGDAGLEPHDVHDEGWDDAFAEEPSREVSSEPHKPSSEAPPLLYDDEAENGEHDQPRGRFLSRFRSARHGDPLLDEGEEDEFEDELPERREAAPRPRTLHSEPVDSDAEEPVGDPAPIPHAAPGAAPSGGVSDETQEYRVADVEHDQDEEDVLEETPEFLQDTPEHDRLWFEQRPPRDFDFDG